jgi:hypothetical protein
MTINVRTQTFIILLDTAFTIFYNIPPRIAVPELTLSFSCPELCFEADNGCSYQQLVKHKYLNYTTVQKYAVCDMVQMLCKDGLDDNLVKFHNLTNLNLFILISGNDYIDPEISCAMF